MAYETLSSISGKCSINCSSTLPLSSVLHVPNCSTNLLFVSSITNSLNCSMIFYRTHCIFQELESVKTIDSDRAHGGLYLLDTEVSSYSTSQTLQADGDLTLQLLHQ